VAVNNVLPLKATRCDVIAKLKCLHSLSGITLFHSHHNHSKRLWQVGEHVAKFG